MEQTILPVPQGGTGAGSLTGILKGNGTNPVTAFTLAALQRMMTDVNGLPTTQAEILHQPCQWATTAPLPSSVYNNGASGVGATLTAVSNGALAVDSSNVSVGDRILVKNEATQSHNGIYIVTSAGSVSTQYVLTRGSYSSVPSNMIAGSEVYVQKGSVNSGSVYYQTTTGTIVIGTTNLVYISSNVTVFVDGTTILGNGTSGSPLHSGLATFGPITITGVVNGSNLVFTIPSGIIASSLQIFDGTQYQIQGALPSGNYQVSGTTVTFNAGNAPAVKLTAYGATTATVAAGAISQNTWVGWALSGAFVLSNIVYDATDTTVLSSATVTYPDGSTGVFTTIVINTTFLEIDSYSITNVQLGRTLTQPTVTRNSLGNVTVQPAIIIS